MLRIVFSILALMLWTAALAGSYHGVNDAAPANVSSMVELESGFTDTPERLFTAATPQTSSAPQYTLLGRVAPQTSPRVKNHVYGNASIRSPPITL
ncbi:Uncharacterised protein [Zhongshania aliphaticivorans]|uniref:Uncharacterized protein n=1 Tax=Zhongshania aliphaticivorans TaxID=1470434 RepID=A0A5S9P727_9GAMM|nr:hypothetical protein [Zhongshania aliphaticivorans]CAA0092075.1 Uncharacterised protein [Zhongshania aliphaticivorans]CAA0099406.1 Uncharacterised protein [Zhongshania aliphaticivorans]